MQDIDIQDFNQLLKLIRLWLGIAKIYIKVKRLLKTYLNYVIAMKETIRSSNYCVDAKRVKEFFNQLGKFFKAIKPFKNPLNEFVSKNW